MITIELFPPVMPTVLVILPIVTVTLPVASAGRVTLTTAGSPTVMLATVALNANESLSHLLTVSTAESLKLE